MNSSDSSLTSTTSSSGDSDVSELDLCGEICPFTFVRTRLKLEDMPIGSRLRIVVDFEPASRNIPRSAREWGQEVVEVTSDGANRWVIELRKSCD